MLSPAAFRFLSSLVIKKCAHHHCLREAVFILHTELIICQGTQWVFVSIITCVTEKKKKYLFGDRCTALAWLQGTLSDWRTVVFRICLTSLWLVFQQEFIFFSPSACLAVFLSSLNLGLVITIACLMFPYVNQSICHPHPLRGTCGA